MTTDLQFLAGHAAYDYIRQNGLCSDDVNMVIGASGAAKWLVLHGLESAIFGQWFRGRKQPLHLYGTSIGSWKSAAAANQDPVGAFDTLANAYIHQYYEGKITAAAVARETSRIMGECLGPGVAEEILTHPYCRVHFSAVRCRGPLASDVRSLEMAGLVLGWLLNRVSRRLFRQLCQPTLFYDKRDLPPFIAGDEFPGGRFQLTSENLRQALLASGSIPTVMESVRHIPGVTRGAYRDGGLYHYHPAFDFLPAGDGIVLYPHFYSQATLGWLDKGRNSRVAGGKQLNNVLLLAPSPNFVARLPSGRIPDRSDFVRLAGRDQERVTAWEQVVRMSSQLGECFLNAVESGRIRSLVRRIE